MILSLRLGRFLNHTRLLLIYLYKLEQIPDRPPKMWDPFPKGIMNKIIYTNHMIKKSIEQILHTNSPISLNKNKKKHCHTSTVGTTLTYSVPTPMANPSPTDPAPSGGLFIATYIYIQLCEICIVIYQVEKPRLF